jgi:hypothetical protein
MKFIRIIPLFFILIHACVEPLELDEYGSYKSQLVVDGAITDQPGPYTVSLYLSAPANTDLDLPSKVGGAIVTLYDDQGTHEQLEEISPGKYQTSAAGIRGTIGRKYHLTITINDKEYVSSSQEMLPAGTITDLFGEFEENVINHGDLTKPQDVIRIYFNAAGEDGYPNLFRWRWSAIYEVKTFPELRVRFEGNSPFPIPDPFPCSGYVYDGMLRMERPCTCCNCWVDEFGNNALVSNNQFLTNDTFNKVLLTTLPYTFERFSRKYYLKMEQISVNEDIYAFWKLVQSQQEGVGNIFQPNSIKIKGNISCVTDPGESVLGIFSVSAVTEKSFFIPPGLTEKRMAIDTIRAPCKEAYSGSTDIKPPFW